MRGHVYFAQAFSGGPIKIGYTEDLKGRLAALNTSSAEPVEFVGVIPGKRSTERGFHDIFADGRLNGEWFSEDTPGLGEMIEVLTAFDLAGKDMAATAAAFRWIREECFGVAA